MDPLTALRLTTTVRWRQRRRQLHQPALQTRPVMVVVMMMMITMMSRCRLSSTNLAPIVSSSTFLSIALSLL